MYRLNSRGLRLQPCLTPLRQGKDEERTLFAVTLQEAFPYIDCSMFRILVLTPISASFFQSRLCLIESKALAKSTKQAYSGLHFFLYACIAVERIKIGSVVLLPSLKPNWASFNLPLATVHGLHVKKCILVVCSFL